MILTTSSESGDSTSSRVSMLRQGKKDSSSTNVRLFGRIPVLRPPFESQSWSFIRGTLGLENEDRLQPSH